MIITKEFIEAGRKADAMSVFCKEYKTIISFYIHPLYENAIDLGVFSSNNDYSVANHSANEPGGRIEASKFWAHCKAYDLCATTMSTLMRQLRAGDKLTFRWYIGGGSINTRDAGLCWDMCYATVSREYKSGWKEIGRYKIDESLCPPHSFARLARPTM